MWCLVWQQGHECSKIGPDRRKDVLIIRSLHENAPLKFSGVVKAYFNINLNSRMGPYWYKWFTTTKVSILIDNLRVQKSTRINAHLGMSKCGRSQAHYKNQCYQWLYFQIWWHNPGWNNLWTRRGIPHGKNYVTNTNACSCRYYWDSKGTYCSTRRSETIYCHFLYNLLPFL